MGFDFSKADFFSHLTEVEMEHVESEGSVPGDGFLGLVTEKALAHQTSTELCSINTDMNDQLSPTSKGLKLPLL